MKQFVDWLWNNLYVDMCLIMRVLLIILYSLF